MFPVVLAAHIIFALEPIPEDQLARLPEKAITFEFVVQKALAGADSFEVIRADKFRLDVPLWNALRPYDPVLIGDFHYFNNANEAASPLMPKGQKTFSTSLRIRSQIPTGTSLELSFLHEKIRLDLQSVSPLRYHDTKLGFQITQSLIRDAFGMSGRYSLRSGVHQHDALSASLMEKGEDWVLNLHALFLSAWLAQNEVMTSKERVARRRHLVDIMKRRVRRGTSVTSELLQVESALLNSQNALLAARQRLNELWRGLIEGFNLPRELLRYNPETVPVKLDESPARAAKLCAEMKLDDIIEQNTQVRRTRLEAASAEAKEKSVKFSTWPELKAYGGMRAGNVDESFVNSLTDSLHSRHSMWQIGIELHFPILQTAGKIERAQAAADHYRARSLAAAQQTDLRIRWPNQCQNLKITTEELARISEMLRKQSQREKLEQERFQIGDTTAFNVVEAGDDAADVEFLERSRQAEIRRIAWELIRTSGSLVPNLVEAFKVQ